MKVGVLVYFGVISWIVAGLVVVKLPEYFQPDIYQFCAVDTLLDVQLF